MSLIYNATFDKNTRKLSFEDKAGNEIYSFTVPERGPAVDDITKPLTFKAKQDGSTVKLTKNGSIYSSFQTSRDGGNTWLDYTLDTAIALNTGDEVSFRVRAYSRPGYNKGYSFKMTGKIEAWHNVMSMKTDRLGDTSGSLDPMEEYEFQFLFSGCSSLTKAPALPATRLAEYCYYGMFSGCQSLTKAPALPATALDRFCYKYMFRGCQSLTKAPELPATTLASNCYSGMFSGCQSLTKAPALPATTLRDYCYYSMFDGCQSLTKAPELPATTLASNCYSGMFSGCQSLTKAPELPATTLAQSCYYSMFDGCQSLTKAPELPATTLAQSCYKNMFSGCSSLTKAPELPATTLAQSCYVGMFDGCGSLNEVRCQMPSTLSEKDISSYTSWWLEGVSATGTFYTNADANWPSGASGIPEGWNRVNEETPAVDDITKPLTFKATQDGSTVKLTDYGSPDGAFQTSRDGGNTWSDYTIGTAIALNTGDEVSFRAKADRSAYQYTSAYWYFMMGGRIEAWHNVMSLYRANDFATYDTAVGSVFAYLFQNCTSLTKAPVLPATTLNQACYYHMFEGCQSLTKAPELPATTLAEGCYYLMFSGCQSLKEVRISATTTSTNTLLNWLSGVSATGDFYCDPNATFPSGESGIPENWTRRNIADYPVTP